MRLGRHRGKWIIRWTDPDGTDRRKATGLPATAEYREQAEALVSESERQARQRPEGASVADIFQAYIEDAPRRSIPVTQIENLEYAAKATLPFFGHLSPEEINRDLCRTYIARRRAAGKGDGTIRTQMAYLRAAVNWHDDQSGARFELPAAPQPLDEFLTSEEIDKLLAAAVSPHVRVFLIVGLHTAARREAILGLTWSTHIDFDRGEVWLGFKAGGKGRAPRLPMTTTLNAALRDAQGLALCDHVVEYAGRPVTSIRTALRATYQRAGLGHIKRPAHVLRHTAARRMAEQGVSMEIISQVLGHSSIAVTERVYARFSPQGMRAAMGALEG